MKRKLLAVLFFAFTVKAFSQALSGGNTYPVNGTQNPPVSFSTLQNVATYLRDSGITGLGNVIIELQTGYLAAAEPATGIVFDTIKGATIAKRVVIRPAAGFSVTISGTITQAGMVNLRGTQFLTIDGRQGGSGAVGLTFANTSSSALDSTCTIRFMNDASNNIIRYCLIQGASKSTALGGVVFFSRGIATGNSSNTIDNCSIDGTGLAHNGICSNGNTLSPATQNQGNVISNNKIYDWFNSFLNLTCNGLLMSQGNSGWIINANSFYQTVPRAFTAQSLMGGMSLSVSYTGDTHTITNNFIGGSGPGATGTMTISSATNIIGFIGLNSNGIGGAGHTIEGNTIKNVSLTHNATGGSFTNSGITCFLGFNGASAIIRNNIVDSLIFNTTATSINPNGIIVQARNSVAASSCIENVILNSNTVSNVISNVVAGQTSLAMGIRVESMSGNSMPSTCINKLNISVDSNTISGIVGNVNAVNSATRGVFVTTTQGTSSAATLSVNPSLNNNIIQHIWSGGKLNNNPANPVAVAMQVTAVNAVDTISIQRNTIRYIRNTNSADTGSTVTGILINNGIYHVNANRIYDLTSASSGATTTPTVYGINIRTASANGVRITNNYISLGKNQTGNAYMAGIMNNATSSFPLNIFNNTVLISGTASGALNSTPLARSTEALGSVSSALVIRNNMFFNKRTGGTGRHYAIVLAGATGITGGHNFYAATDSTICYLNNAPVGFRTLVNAQSSEEYSYSATSAGFTNLSTEPAFIHIDDLYTANGSDSLANFSVNNANPASWLLYGKGFGSSAVPADYSNASRSIAAGIPVCIGGEEFTTSTTPPACAIGGSIAANDSTLAMFASRHIARIRWNSGTLPSAVAVRYYSGKEHPAPGTGNRAKSYWQITATGGSGYNYNLTVAYSAAETGNITNGDQVTKLAYYTGAAWNYLGTSTASTASTPQSAAQAPFTQPFSASSAFTLTDSVTKLPVKLASFSGRLKGAQADLSWTTVSEANSSHFIIERSIDGKKYVDIGRVKAKGTTNEKQFYGFTDHQVTVLGASTIYYRLRQVDADGSATHSGIVSVTFTAKTAEPNVVVTPNPFSSDLKVAVNIPAAGTLTLRVIDITGKTVVEKNAHAEAGLNNITLDEVAAIPSGIYYLNITGAGQPISKKIIKMN